jgi:hypothetical protein
MLKLRQEVNHQMNISNLTAQDGQPTSDLRSSISKDLVRKSSHGKFLEANKDASSLINTGGNPTVMYSGAGSK